MVKTTKNNASHPSILLSTDTLWGYGLDLIFSIAKDSWCQWIDLAMRKNYDTRHETYVKKLIDEYQIPVEIIQTSSKINAKELNQAIVLAQTTGAKHIAINAPSYFEVKAYSFLTNNLHTYQEQYPDIQFSIISPDTTSMKYLPLPKYRFANLADIIKKYKCHLGLDIAALDEETLENFVIVKMPALVEHINVCYVSDRQKEKKYLLPGEWTYNIVSVLKSLYQYNYTGFFSIKLDLDPQILVDNDKVLWLITKSVEYICNHSWGQ